MKKQPAGPLSGIRVVDLTQFVLGPYATQTLGDLGADVIKIEEPGGDRQRRAGKSARSKDMGSAFMQLNRNKRSVALDLKSDDGRAKLTELIKTADVFIHNMRIEAVARLGFGYDAVAKIKPDIVYVQARGYGSKGPYAKRQAFDDLVQAASGASGLTMRVDGSDVLRPMPSLVADKVSGLHALYATLAALIHKLRTGEGQFVEVPMLELFTAFTMIEHLYGHSFEPAVGKIGDSTVLTPERRHYETKDGHIAILPASREGAAAFMKLGGVELAYEDPRFTGAHGGKAKVEAYYALMREAAASRTTEDWLHVCDQNNIPAMRANTLESVLDDPHLKAVDFFELRETESAGTWRAMKPPIEFSKTPAGIHRDPPAIGEHTDEVLAELKRNK